MVDNGFGDIVENVYRKYVDEALTDLKKKKAKGYAYKPRKKKLDSK